MGFFNSSSLFTYERLQEKGLTEKPKLNEVACIDWIFQRGKLSTLSINYVGMGKDMGKRLPAHLYYIKMKIYYDLGFIANGVAMAT